MGRPFIPNLNPDVVSDLLTALGLADLPIIGLTLHMEPDKVATATVVLHLTVEDVAGLEKVVKHYQLQVGAEAEATSSDQVWSRERYNAECERLGLHRVGDDDSFGGGWSGIDPNRGEQS